MKTRPTSAGLKGFLPRPPKVILPTPIDTSAPTATIHSGMDEGKLKASSIPVTTADQLLTVSGPRSRKRCIRYSNTTQQATDVHVTNNTLNPNTHVDTASAGSSAITTSSISRDVVCCPWTCGEGETIKFLSISISFLFFSTEPRSVFFPVGTKPSPERKKPPLPPLPSLPGTYYLHHLRFAEPDIVQQEQCRRTFPGTRTTLDAVGHTVCLGFVPDRFL